MEFIREHSAVMKKSSIKLQGRLNRFSFLLFTLPALLLYVSFFIIPALMGFYYSTTNWDGISKTYSFVGLNNYIAILSDKRFGNSMGFTLYYTVLIVTLKLFISLILALLLSSRVKFRGFMRSVYFFPAVLSLVTVGLIFNQIFYAVVPPIGKYFGIEWMSRNILSNQATAVYGILFTNLWQGVAIPMIIFMAGLSSVPKDLHEAATIDGATPVQRFFSITLPFLIPMLNVNLIIAIKSGLTVFDYIVAMTGGGPVKATESIGFLIYQHGFFELKFAYATAESVIIFLLIALISFVQMKFLNKKEAGQQ